MYMIFLSESGLTGVSANDPNQPHHVHAGLLIQESQYVSISGEYDALVRRHFGSPPGSGRRARRTESATHVTRARARSGPGGPSNAPS